MDKQPTSYRHGGVLHKPFEQADYPMIVVCTDGKISDPQTNGIGAKVVHDDQQRLLFESQISAHAVQQYRQPVFTYYAAIPVFD